MPTNSKKPMPLPAQDVAWIDPITGKPTPLFYQFMKSLEAAVIQLRTEIP